MTSRSLCFKLMKEDTKRRGFVLALSVLVFFIKNVFGTLYEIQNYGFQYGWLSEELRSNVDINSADLYMIITAITLGVIIAITGFCFLYSKEQVDFYHSLPLSRGQIFIVRYLNGFFMYAIPYFIGLLLSVMIYVVNGRFTGEVMITLLLKMAIDMIYFLIIYTTCIIAVWF